MDLHPTAFVIYGEVEFPLSQENLKLLKQGYLLKHTSPEELDMTEEEKEHIEYKLFHEKLGDGVVFDPITVHHPVMIRPSGEVVRVETGEVVGKLN